MISEVRLKIKLQTIRIAIACMCLGASCVPLTPLHLYGETIISGMKEAECLKTQTDRPCVIQRIDTGSLSSRLEDMKKVLKESKEELLHMSRHASSGQIPPCPNRTTCADGSGLESRLKAQLSRLEGQIDRLVAACEPFTQSEDEDCEVALASHSYRLEALTNSVADLSKRVLVLEKKFSNENQTTTRGGCWLVWWAAVILVVLMAGCFAGDRVSRFMKKRFEMPSATTDAPSVQRPSNIYAADAHRLIYCSKEITETYRHYSNLRFALFTLFLAISGAMGSLYFHKDYLETTLSIRPFLPVIGVIVTAVFAVLEFAVDLIQTEYSYMAKAAWDYQESFIGPPAMSHHKVSPLGATATMSKDWIRMPIATIFVLAFGFWVVLFFAKEPTHVFPS